MVAEAMLEDYAVDTETAESTPEIPFTRAYYIGIARERLSVNTHLALTEDIFRLLETLMDKRTNPDNTGIIIANVETNIYHRLLKEFHEGSLLLAQPTKDEVPEPQRTEIEQSIEARRTARTRQDYVTADRIKTELLEQGVILEDNRYGTTEWKLREKSPEELLETQARSIARLLGIRMALICETIQEWILSERIGIETEDDLINQHTTVMIFTKMVELSETDEERARWKQKKKEATGILRSKGEHARETSKASRYNQVPIIVMSEVINNPENSGLFNQIRTAIRAIAISDPTFAETLYECVPVEARPRRHRDEPFSERHQYQLLEYTIYQLASVITLSIIKPGLVKLGHPGENPYNRATALAVKRLGIRDSVSFETITPKGREGVDYREESPETPSAHKLSTHIDWHGERMRAIEEGMRIRMLNRQCKLSDKDFYAQWNQIGKQEHQARIKHEELERRAIGIRRNLIQKIGICTSLTPEEKRALISAEIEAQAKETILTMAHNEKLRCVMEHLGLIDVATGKKQPSSLSDAPKPIPFACPRLPGETEGEYLARYVIELGESGILSTGDMQIVGGHLYARYIRTLRELANPATTDQSFDFRQFERDTFEPFQPQDFVHLGGYEEILFERGKWRKFDALLTEAA